ncbi:hypothetical protein AB1L30_04190 [Bremerella sp. JC817]|uniref:hypothetical protein n=1 Tax=Bremerella sp. JC817 TaxID=3231756 RepID=UPI00345AA7AE
MKRFAPLCLGLIVMTAFSALAEEKTAEEKKPATITFSEGQLEMTVPEGWKTIKPRVNIIEHEFRVPGANGDEDSGRVTMMGASGGVEANVLRWKGQFTKMSKDAVEKEETISNTPVHIVELTGDFKDQRGPFAPAEVKEGYTMLGAIFTTEKQGEYYLKFYGPSDTVEKNKEKFMEMVNSFKIK